MNTHADDRVPALLDRQKRAWEDGARPSVEQLLSDAGLEGDPEAFLDLVYNEVVLREERGEGPSLAEYVERYPQLADDLRLHFEVHSALYPQLVTETRRLDGDSLPDGYADPGSAQPRLDNYELVSRLGQGGMGVVYKARQRLLRRFVAVKMFQPGRVPSRRDRARFKTEAEAIARLQHPNIVQIFEIGESDGTPFLALELAEHGTLADRLQKLTYAPRAAAGLVETLARAIAHAHDEGVLHRDLKPANILFARDDTPKITDFGLAKMLEDDAAGGRDTTRSGEPMGTPRYMAPEQAAGRTGAIGVATDVYALGVVLYECLTGQAPFVSSSAVETMDRIRTEEPLPPRRLQRSIPKDLETICLCCLNKEPGRRYRGAQDLADDLRRFLDGAPIRARRTPAWERVWKWSRRRPLHAIGGAAGFLFIAGMLVFLLVRDHLERLRLDALRQEVIGLIEEGRQALDAQDDRTAQARFLSAWTKVRTEPALADFQTAASGWLDHGRRVAEKEHAKKRRPPPLFDELRDEALLQSLLAEVGRPESLAATRLTIEAALDLTVADDPAWEQERELLTLLDAGLLLQEGKADAALDLMDRTKGASRLWRLRRADCLERLGKKDDAARERAAAERFPPRSGSELVLSGVDRFQRGDASGAAGEFDKALLLEPANFTARLFQSVCFLRLKRPAEAKVALTACLGERPAFAWCYLLRGRACLALKDPDGAERDWALGLEAHPSESARLALLEASRMPLAP
ncbi:MAG: protein kinase [Gemmataceae bacterium]